MSKSTLIKIKIFKATINTAIFVAVFSFALLLGKFFEGIVAVFTYFLLRYKFDKTFHCKNMWICVILSILMCWIMIAMTLPLNISLLSGVVVALVDCYILYKIKDYYDIKEAIEKLKEKVDELSEEINKNKDKFLYSMNEGDLRQFGATHGLSVIQQDILVNRVIDHLKISEICKYRNYGRTTIKYHIGEIKQKLNIDNI